MTIGNTTGSDTTDSVCHWLFTFWTISHFYYYFIANLDFFLSTEVVVAESVVVIKKLLQLKVKN